MDPESLIERNNELPSARVDTEIVFLNAALKQYVALDDVGRRIWELLESPRRLTDLLTELEAQFEGPRDAITADVVAFVEQLEHEGIVRVIDA